MLDLARALPRGDRAELGRLCAASYAGARDLYEIAVPAMDAMLAAMLGAPGVIGARQAGAGFDGCLVALVEAGQVGPFQAHAAASYRSATGIEPAVYPVQATDGAGPLG